MPSPTNQRNSDLLHQLAAGAGRVRRLRKRGPEQPLRRDRLPPGALVEPLERGIERGEPLINNTLDHSQRMLGRHPARKIDVGKQRPRPRIRSAHGKPLEVEPERNHIRECLSAGEKFNSLLARIFRDALRND